MFNLNHQIPLYENAIFMGDKAAEALSALRIFPKGLIGGDIPLVEKLHPYESLIECTACAMGDKHRVLSFAAKKMNADYILLEDNKRDELNPASIKEELINEGFNVKILDVSGNASQILNAAGALFGREWLADRVLRNMEEQKSKIKSEHFKNYKVLTLLNIRHPLNRKDFTYIVNPCSDMGNILREELNTTLIGEHSKVAHSELTELTVNAVREILTEDIDLIAFCGDALGAQMNLFKILNSNPELADCNAVKNRRFFPLDFYVDALFWRKYQILLNWQDALMA